MVGKVGMRPFVALSASYGARGSEIGPAVATRLGVPFFDRAISAQVADRLGISPEDPLLLEERRGGILERLVASVGASGLLLPMAGVPIEELANLVDESTLQAEIDRVIRGASDGSSGGVLLGRAGAVVLAEHPRALHVRLDGPRERRVRIIQHERAVDEKEATRLLRDNDNAREAYVKQVYGADAKDQTLYHVMIGSTVIAPSVCVELIALAANFRNRPESSTNDHPATD
jgi:cytidylate kinase